MRDFKHVDAKSVDATVTLLKESEGMARVIAGNRLARAIKMRYIQPFLRQSST